MDQSEAKQVAWGEALKQARLRAGKTQMDVCRETEATPAAIYRWEAGKAVPQLRFLRKLRELFPELPDLPQGAETSAA